MKGKKKLRRDVRRAEDKVEEIRRKMKHINDAMLFIVMGMEASYQSEDSCEVNTIHTIREYLRTLRTEELAELERLLEHLKKI